MIIFTAGSCQITTISCNDDNDELYVGTNSGCMIVAESGGSLKPITIFRPYNHEVKFILAIPEYVNSHTKFIDQSKTIIESEVQNTPQTGRNALRTLWPFNKSNRMIKDSRNVNEDVQLDIEDNKKKRRKPFVSLGRGYRNLLDRFINTSKCIESNNLHAIIWDSGKWNIE